MASTPDAHPDSIPAAPSDAPEQVSPPGRGGHTDIENIPNEGDTPGTDGGTAGTGGTNPNQEYDVTS